MRKSGPICILLLCVCVAAGVVSAHAGARDSGAWREYLRFSQRSQVIEKWQPQSPEFFGDKTLIEYYDEYLPDFPAVLDETPLPDDAQIVMIGDDL